MPVDAQTATAPAFDFISASARLPALGSIKNPFWQVIETNSERLDPLLRLAASVAVSRFPLQIDAEPCPA
jgi:hypothetical protein